MTSWFASACYAAPLALFGVGLIARLEGARARPALTLVASRAAAWLSLGLAALAAVFVALWGPLTSPLLGAQGLGFSLRLDAVSAALFAMVAVVGAVVLGFSRSYLAGDPRQGRFLAGIAQTVGAVLLLVLAGNLVQLVVAWVAMSLSLEQLLLFHRDRPAARAATRKEALFARLSDVCLIGAAVLLGSVCGSGELDVILPALQAQVGQPLSWSLTSVAALVAIAAGLKSAIFPTHGWLLEVMETPTPVSALLHAGVVNAGPLLLVRLGDLLVLDPWSSAGVIVLGGVTALLASVAMLSQPAVKVSLAWSSAAHMGFSFMLCGLGAHSVAILHLISHSCYKAHAFLSSGSAVEFVRGFAGVEPTEGPRADELLSSMGGAILLLLVVAGVSGLAPEPGLVTLALTLVFGLAFAQLLTRVVVRGQPLVIWGVAATAGVALALVVLEAGAAALLASALSHSPSALLALPAGQALVLAGVACFAAVFVVQALLPRWSHRPWGRAAWVHLRRGLYVNALWDRLLGTWRRSEPAGQAQESSPSPSPAPEAAPLTPAEVDAAVARSAGRVAPLWPLERFVAVNPFLGLADRRFEAAAEDLTRSAGAQLTAPLEHYARALEDGRLKTRDLNDALEAQAERDLLSGEDRASWTAGRLAELALSGAADDLSQALAPTVAEVTGSKSSRDWERFVTQSVSSWAGSYYDQGQAVWASPFRTTRPFAAWRAEALLDREPELAGVTGFRGLVARLPERSPEVARVALAELGVPRAGLDAYLSRLLMSVRGWAGYARFRGWERAQIGATDPGLTDLLAIVLVWELALLEAHGGSEVSGWSSARAALTAPLSAELTRQLDGRLLLQDAYERAVQRETFAALEQGLERRAELPERPAVQAAFCIDVRSEVYRRALEASHPGLETIGFAGFFGMPLEFVRLGDAAGAPRCPVLLQPEHVVQETVDVDPPALESLREQRAQQRAWGDAFRAFKQGAVSCFGFVSALGLGHLYKLIRDSLGLGNPVKPADDLGLPSWAKAQRRPELAVGELWGRPTGLSLDQRVELAAGAVKGMGLGARCARLVLLAGHGATTINNPHAAGLHCGACGGQPGGVNARVAAQLLNDRAVRVRLRERGIELPHDTWFVAGEHETVTDVVTLFDAELAPEDHRAEVRALRRALEAAGALARQERAPSLGLAQVAGESLARQLSQRAADWAQVRPEWGLAGCASFVAAPRQRTAATSLAGRAFLHDYDWRQDEDFSLLELIMTAPVVVASWINLQYYGSAVDNRVFGAGDKTLHNVVGGLGVLEGNGGDLRVGLPLQSLHDGERLVHDPVRLSVLIEAPVEAMNQVIANHDGLRQLVDNGWLHLFALDSEGRPTERYVGGLAWQPTREAVRRLVAA